MKIAMLVGNLKNQNSKIFMALSILNVLLIAFVLTNDLHNLVFKLDLSKSDWDYNYDYGFMYFVIAGTMLIELIGSIILLFKKAKNSPNRYGFIFLIFFISALLTYIYGYVTRIPFFYESDMSLAFCTFSLLFLEMCIRIGGIPSNSYYRKLFEMSEIKLQITDTNGNNLFISKDTDPIKNSTWEKLIASDTPIKINPNTLLLKDKISGGYAVWKEDITAMNILKQALEEANRKLETSNKILSKNIETQRQITNTKTLVETYSKLEQEVSSHEKRLKFMLDNPPSNKNEQDKFLGTIAVLICYTKRKYDLFYLKSRKKEIVSINELIVYINELAEIAELTGIKNIISCDLKCKINIKQFSLFYDFFDSVLEWAIMNKNKSIYIQIISEDEKLTMKLLMSRNSLNYRLPNQLQKEVNFYSRTF
jgi:hypothetical protein